jgi:hypothetical protein
MPKIAHLADTELSEVIIKYLKANIEVLNKSGRQAGQHIYYQEHY